MAPLFFAIGCGGNDDPDAGPASDSGPRDTGTVADTGPADGGSTDSGSGCDPNAALVEIISSEGLFYTNPRLSPDATRIAVLAWRGFTLEDVLILDRCGLVTDRLQLGGLIEPISTWGPVFSPDGQSIFYAGNDEAIYRVAIGSTTRTKVADTGNLTQLDVSPDGTKVLYYGGAGLEVLDLGGGSPAIELLISGVSPRFSPDGSKIAYVAGEVASIIDIATRTVSAVDNIGLGASVDWLPSGDGVVITTAQGVEHLLLSSPPARTTLRSETVARDVDVAADGSAAVFGLNGQPAIRVIRLGTLPHLDGGSPDSGSDAGLDSGLDGSSPDVGSDGGLPDDAESDSGQPDSGSIDGATNDGGSGPDANLNDCGLARGVLLASPSLQGTAGAYTSDEVEISSDGRYVVFNSGATDLVPNDTNQDDDIFVYDRTSATVERVNLDNLGLQVEGTNRLPSISADGQVVTFWSLSQFDVPDFNFRARIWVRDRIAGTTILASRTPTGGTPTGDSLEAEISADGRWVVYTSAAEDIIANDTNGYADVFVFDRQNLTTERVSVDSAGNQATFGNSMRPAISADGRFVSFDSGANNLVAGDTNTWADVFVRDRMLGTTERVSVTSAGAQAAYNSSYSKISADGRYVAFFSASNDLVPGDNNISGDVFVRDRAMGITERVSVDSSGVEAQYGATQYLDISDDGRFVSYTTGSVLDPADTNTLVEMYVRDRANGTTQLVSLPTVTGLPLGYSDPYEPRLSGDGRLIAFSMNANELVSTVGMNFERQALVIANDQACQ